MTIGALRTDIPVKCCAAALAVAVFGYAIYILLIGLDDPVLANNGFRESQTALSAYWLSKGGPLIAYETPVLGFPWSIPLEFPLYQWLVALPASAGLSIHFAGRIVSFAFLLACLVPLCFLLKALGFSSFAYTSIAVLFLASPLHLTWGRAVLIETCALFFCLAWFTAIVCYLARPRGSLLVLAILLGMPAALVKSTTFFGFAVATGLVIAIGAFHAVRHRRSLKPSLLALAAVVLAGLAGFGWLQYSDAVKAHNPIGVFLVPRNLYAFVFGTIEQRLDIEGFWREIVASRMMPDVFGYGAVVAGVAIISSLATRHWCIAATCLIAFLVTLMTFTNLHRVHPYYLTAIAIFLILPAGVAIGAAFDRGYKLLAAIALVAIAGGQIFYAHRHVAPGIAGDHSQSIAYQVGRAAAALTHDGDSLIVLGLDWTSEVAYYSGRKTLTVPQWLPADLRSQVFKNPQAFLGSARFALVVFCAYHPYEQDRAFVSNLKMLTTINVCSFYSTDAT